MISFDTKQQQGIPGIRLPALDKARSMVPQQTPAPAPAPAPAQVRATPVAPAPAPAPVAPAQVRVQESIPAERVVAPQTTPQVYTPKQAPLQRFDTAAQIGQDGVLRMQNEYTKQLEAMRDTIGGLDLDTQGTYQNTFDELARQQGYSDSKALMDRLADESAKLAQIQGKYRTREYDITTSPETMATQAGLLTEMNRRSQIEIGNQALLVQALQGSYNTARQTAMDVAGLAYQDKREQIDALKWQYGQIADMVEGEQKQMLEERRRLLDQEERALEESRGWIQSAIQSGGASADELYSLTSPQVSDEDKAILAQQIVARVEGGRLADERAYNRARTADLVGGGVGGGGVPLTSYNEDGVEIQNATTPPKAPTEGEKNSLSFFNRMKEAINNLEKVEQTIAQGGFGAQVRLKLPTWLQTEEEKLYSQAARQFTEARLRKESGAAIPDSEFENDRITYFPQIGDSPSTLAQKRQARETTMIGLRQAAGNAYWDLYGQSPSEVTREKTAERNEYQALLSRATPQQLQELGIQ